MDAKERALAVVLCLVNCVMELDCGVGGLFGGSLMCMLRLVVY